MAQKNVQYQTQVAEDGILLARFCKNCNGHLNSISSKEFLDYLRNSWLLNKDLIRPENLKGDGIEEPCSWPNIQNHIVCRRDRLHWQLDCLDLRKYSFTLIHVLIDLEFGVKALLVNDEKGAGSSPRQKKFFGSHSNGEPVKSHYIYSARLTLICTVTWA